MDYAGSKLPARRFQSQLRRWEGLSRLSETKQLLPAERLERIRRILQTRGAVRVATLSAELGVSEVTVRSDLDRLERDGMVERTHGGAMPAGLGRTRFERPFSEQQERFAAEKRRIGQAAAATIAAGDTIILDVGTTTTEIARQLPVRDDVVVMTNGLNIALELERHQATVLVMGGTLRPLQHSLVNPYATLLLSQVHADRLFLGCNGVAVAAGVTNSNLPEAEVKQAMIKAAKHVTVVADGSKVGKVAAAHVAELGEIHCLITDTGADPDELQRIRQAGVQVTVV